LRHSGASRPLAILYGLLPQAAKELASYTVYRWECAIRASVVMGFVGAGGLGQLMDQAMKMLNGGEAASILLAFMLLVFAADGLSGWLRARSTPRPPPASPFGWRSLLVAAAIGGGMIASFRFLDIGFGELLTADAARSMGEFVAGFFPPDLSAEWLAKVGRASGRRWPSPSSAPCSPPSPACCSPCPGLRAVQLPAQYAALGAGTGLGHDHRAGRGPRPFAGALALALHTAGVLGRLYAEALANAPAPGASAAPGGAGNGLAFLYGTLPGAARN
jgi:phosphonate transport system permease protein